MAYIGNQPTTVAFLTDQFSGTGSQTAFTLSAAPANTASILVAVTGVLQDPSTYSVSGTTLTFSAAPPSGTGNISVRFLGIPASGIVTTAYRTVTDFTATASQTTFTPPSYTAGFINVYRNGARLGAADYTATNGTTVVLATGATSGDLITTESFSVSSVLNAIPATAGSVNSTYLQSGITITSPTITSPTISGTYTAGTSLVTSGTAVNAATGSPTSIDFTGIPSWVKRVTVTFSGVSLSGTSTLLVQIGSGSVTTSGYLSTANAVSAGPTVSNTNSTAGFIMGGATAANIFSGNMIISAINSTLYCESFAGKLSSGATSSGGGDVTLSGALDRVRITTVNGTDTFDAGTINIMYE